MHLTEPLLSHTPHTQARQPNAWSRWQIPGEMKSLFLLCDLGGGCAPGSPEGRCLSDSLSLVSADFPHSCSFPIPPPSMETVKCPCALPSLLIKLCPRPLLLIVVSGVPETGHDPSCFVFPFLLYVPYFFSLMNPQKISMATIPQLHPHHTLWPHFPPRHG